MMQEQQQQRPRDRRRQKPLLSCLFCRTRKVRCDRQFPCSTCIARGIASSCSYSTNRHGSSATKVSVAGRIEELETLVRSLLDQQQQQQSQQKDSSEVATSPPNTAGTPGALPCHPTSPQPAPNPSGHNSPASSIISSRSRRYVASVHWAAVLDSIADLRDHYHQEERDAHMMSPATPDNNHDHDDDNDDANDDDDDDDDDVGAPSPPSGPRLLYYSSHVATSLVTTTATRNELLAAVPPRPAVDRMVARYFKAHPVVPEIVHSVHFLAEYERFWSQPAVVPLPWLGLLFSIMCVATQYQICIEQASDPDTLERIQIFQDNTVRCLIINQYTRGGDYVLETMINYVTSERFSSRDDDKGLWLVLGMLVQLALSLGLHRDPHNFPHLSPFAGEMRRRIWAIIVQMDLRLSSQMALPRLLRWQQYDTVEPRNLLDSDFNEMSATLPPSRPETEVTPVLYSLAKSRIDRLNGLVSDLVNETHEHPYQDILALHQQIEAAEASLPPIFRWQPLSQSFMVLPEIVMHRLLLQLSIQRLTIWLHRKYLAPQYAAPTYKPSRDACIHAAIRVLEFQELVEEETRRGGLLAPVRWICTSSGPQAVFLLGLSILCYSVQLSKSSSASTAVLNPETAASILRLLQSSYPLWLRSATVSREAKRAMDTISLLLSTTKSRVVVGDAFSVPDAHVTADTTAADTDDSVPNTQDFTMSLDGFTWDAYNECFSDFPATSAFGTDFMGPGLPASSSGATAVVDPLQNLALASTNEWDI